MFLDGDWKPVRAVWAWAVAANVSKDSTSRMRGRGDNMSFSRSQNVMPGLDPGIHPPSI
jgi:uncharacterized protein (DUF2237 family)